MSSIHRVGSPALFLTFWTLWLRPRIHLFPIRFEEFTVPSKNICLCRSSTVQASVVCSSLCLRGNTSPGTILFWIRSVIDHACASACEKCRALWVKAYKVWKVTTSLLFWRTCAVYQVLKAGTWSLQSTFSVFYLWDVTHRHMDNFCIIPVVAAAQQVM